jgi:hypothetical protein
MKNEYHGQISLKQVKQVGLSIVCQKGYIVEEELNDVRKKGLKFVQAVV